MKKLISIFMCIVMLIIPLSIAFTSSALGVSINDGITALRNQWQSGEDSGVDYVFYSPVADENDDTKYPLVIILHGKFSGDYPGAQINSNNFPYWSSIEYQSRFAETGGAYILMPRSPGGSTSGWGSSFYDDDFFVMLDTFVARHGKNIDTNKISLGGWSVGGEGTVRIASKQPERFCAVFPMAPYNGISQSQADKLCDTPTWLFLCEKDTMAPYGIVGAPSWNRIKNSTNVPDKCILTLFSKYDYYDIQNHYVHNAVIVDLLNQPSDCGMRTMDANGNTVITDETHTFLMWLSQQSLAVDEDIDTTCSCDCHSSNGFTSFFWKIKCFFWKIFSPSKKTCSCGATHW